jgi:hypothetical protein
MNVQRIMSGIEGHYIPSSDIIGYLFLTFSVDLIDQYIGRENIVLKVEILRPPS